MKVRCIDIKGTDDIIKLNAIYEVLEKKIIGKELFYKINVFENFYYWIKEHHFTELIDIDVTYKAVDKFGLKQLDIVQEECAELIQAISKYKRNKSETNKLLVLEELADNHIMLRQLEILFGFDEDLVEEMIIIKKKKLENYLNEVENDF